MLDLIRIPDRRWFASSDEFYKTLYHELLHASGHPKRLNRFEIGTIVHGDNEYSKEELVAELGVSFLGEIAHLKSDIRNSAAYIRGWANIF